MTEYSSGNIWDISTLPHPMDKEDFQDIFKSNTVRIERIVSTGQISPPNFWYNQEENEWVIVLKGKAILNMQDNHGAITKHILNAGDYINIPPHTKHRVDYTDTHAPTIWLAVFNK